MADQVKIIRLSGGRTKVVVVRRGPPGTIDSAALASLDAKYASLDETSRLAVDGSQITPAQVGSITPAQAVGYGAAMALVFGG